MSERLQHSNPWAEKLSQVSLPEWEGGWAAMEATLDREMPKGWWKDWRRWLLLILVLLLLIGVCRCPGRRWLGAVKTAGVAKTAGVVKTVGVVDAVGKAGRGGPVMRGGGSVTPAVGAVERQMEVDKGWDS